MTESWRTVPKTFGHYSASTLGRIRRNAPSKGTSIGRILNPGKRKDGYLNVTLCFNGVHKTMTVHKVITMTFLGSPPRGKQVNHKNGIKTDNRLCNLEYLTPSENQIHCNRVLGKRKGIKPQPRFGTDHPNSKLTDSIVKQIRRYYGEGWTQREIGDHFGLQQSHVGKIVRRVIWPHVD